MRALTAFALTGLMIVMGLLLARPQAAEADIPPDMGRYIAFCCQAAAPPDAAVGGRNLRFGPCYETTDTRWGRQCRQESMYYYPLAVRTDRTFTFDTTTRELILYAP